MEAQPTQKQLLTGWITTTIFEGAGLFAGAILIALSRELGISTLGVIGLLVWWLSLWAENYTVADLVKPAFGLSKPVSLLVMGLAEFVTWVVWLGLFLQTDLPWFVLLVVLAVLTQIHHAIQFCFFYPTSSIVVAMRSPLLWLASVVEAIAGQWLIVQLLNTSQFDLESLIFPFIGLIVLFGVEHLIGGQVKAE
jgi:hypothetical protein